MKLEVVLRDINRLRRAGTRYGKAPHKPILFLTFLDLFDSGIVTENKIYVNSDLVGIFHENWSLLVYTGHQEDFTQPFYYLQNDKIDKKNFWFLLAKPGYSIQSHIKNIYTLSEVLNFAHFSDDLFLLLTDYENRQIIRNHILETFFPGLRHGFLKEKKSDSTYLKSIDSYVLNEIPAVKRLKVAEEEMVYVRNGTFKKWVPKIYQNTCAISKMKLVSTYGYNLIDACHIRPFADNQDDRVTNGIALCPNLHRAFDRGLISIDSNYKVLVSDQIIEDKSHPYGLESLKGTQILLPSEKHLRPDQDNLE
ncbi:MAG TPA: restriction endonuclease [Algoriphagus sp.]|jgi:putative restriction endonuclease|uniref:HNH endonuclease n=2 Tax=Algoriphagus TaxID=246875 RepID=UPI000C3C8934|nr:MULTISPECIES: HNH endonuclease [unclassified Algoriphagus]MAL12699.1 restriction endonuclease [Algoriphagus sp.]MAN85363.1 restriction endonuclease [Algoriphagus sp.]HAD53186.1 restriction endonuclease [Algoriphagus sp.]HCB44924.1 restriction endonuclease [Algoriphagus sp.]HCD86822.1 restriction endonuclease [Algoriphagus sp.]|tara:strand:+ start:930 stop:1853 length:924 start_codon:yes stop_codon:yes gene_type:complete